MTTHETEITFGQGVRGTLLTIPADAPAPAVLMLHGFASHRDEVGDLYARLARALAARGIASLRIDFRGWGTSAGEMADTTVEREVEDAVAGYAALGSHPTVDPQRVGIVGFSLGGSVAMLTAAQVQPPCRSLVLWSSTHELLARFRDELGDDAFAAAERDGIVTCDLGFRTVTLKRPFFESVSRVDVMSAFDRYDGPCMVVAGTQDYSADSLDHLRERARGSLKASFLVQGADHIFNVLSDDRATSETVIEKTIGWLTMIL